MVLLLMSINRQTHTYGLLRGIRNTDYPLWRGRTFLGKECPGYDTKLHRVVKLQFSNSQDQGSVKLVLHGPYCQVLFEPKW